MTTAIASDRMPERLLQFGETILFLLMLASGAIGGCAAASHHMLRGRTLTVWLFMAYAILGSFFGVVVYVIQGVWIEPDGHLQQLIVSVIAGFAGALVLSATNISARFLLRRLGIEVEIRAKRVGDRS